MVTRSYKILCHDMKARWVIRKLRSIIKSISNIHHLKASEQLQWGEIIEKKNRVKKDTLEVHRKYKDTKQSHQL